MAVEQAIKHGDEAVQAKDFLGAIQFYTLALKENPQAFQAYLKRAIAYLKLKNLDHAKKDISTAFTIANDRGKRSEIGLCYFRLAIIYYQERKLKLALSQFSKALEYDCKEATLQMWKDKCEYDLKNHPEWNVDNGDDDNDDDKEEEKKEEEEKEREGEREAAEVVGGERSTLNLDSSGDGNGGKKLKSEVVEKTETTKVLATEAKASKPATQSNVDEINRIAPLSVKIREDWYQSNDDVIITIYAKNIKEDKLKVHFESKSVSISFPSANGSEYNYNLDPLYSEIRVEESRFKIYSTKLEISLRKSIAGKWPSLEKEETLTNNGNSNNKGRQEELHAAYPSSSRKKIDWSNFKVEDETENDGGEPNQFFQQIFKDMDEDSRRAMMKSYVQSNGTVLTTNWEEARDKEFETSPPEGMVAKKWGA